MEHVEVRAPMSWLKRYKHLFPERPTQDAFNIDEALERLQCIHCGGPLHAALLPIDRDQEAWDFRCRDENCKSHAHH